MPHCHSHQPGKLCELCSFASLCAGEAPASVDSIEMVPFQFDLIQLLPKCQQVELFFLTFSTGTSLSDHLYWFTQTIMQMCHSQWRVTECCFCYICSAGEWGASSQLLLSAQWAPAQPLSQQPGTWAQWQRNPIGWRRPQRLHAPHLGARTRRPRPSFLLTCNQRSVRVSACSVEENIYRPCVWKPCLVCPCFCFLCLVTSEECVKPPDRQDAMTPFHTSGSSKEVMGSTSTLQVTWKQFFEHIIPREQSERNTWSITKTACLGWYIFPEIILIDDVLS